MGDPPPPAVGRTLRPRMPAVVPKAKPAQPVAKSRAPRKKKPVKSAEFVQDTTTPPESEEPQSRFVRADLSLPG